MIEHIILCLLFVALISKTDASRPQSTFLRAYDLPAEEMNNLTVAKFTEPSDIGCARLCSRYPGCTSFSLAPGLCALMTARQNVRRQQGGADFYIIKEAEPSCFQEAGTFRAQPFNLSSGYYAAYHPITRIRLYYDDNSTYLHGLDVEHGSEVARTGKREGVIEECQLMDGEFIQRWEYSAHL